MQFDVKNDLNNFLEFMWALRAKLGWDKVISADTSAKPWAGADGNPSNNLSGVSTRAESWTDTRVGG